MESLYLLCYPVNPLVWCCLWMGFDPYFLFSSSAPFLCHPNLWIRYGAVGFITVVAHQISTADVYCKLMPYLDPYITQPIIQVCTFLLGCRPPTLCYLKIKLTSLEVQSYFYEMFNLGCNICIFFQIS